MRGLPALLSLNFFMPDMQAGIGPFLGVFLLAHHWQSGLIGTVMTVGGVALKSASSTTLDSFHISNIMELWKR